MIRGALLPLVRESWRRSLRTKVLVWMIATMVFVLSVATAASVSDAYGRRQQALAERADTLASLFADALGRPLYDFNTPAVDSAVHALAADATVAAVRVVDNEGKVVAAHQRPHDAADVLTARRPVRFVDGARQFPVGEVQLALSRAELHRFLDERIRHELAALALLVATLATSVVLVFRRISRPLGDVARALEDLTAGKTEIALSGLDRGDEIGRMSLAVRAFRDAIRARQHVEAQLAHDALHDALTGLPNRSLFYDRLEQAERRRQRNAQRFFAVIYLDLDRFKTINDSLGHATGDALIIGVARRLEAQVRSQDTVARLGGDEFVILLDDLDDAVIASQRAEEVRLALRRPFVLAGREVHISASLGVAVVREGLASIADLVRDADLAMYRAKECGKDRCAEFDASLYELTVRAMTIETELRHAEERGEIDAYFQPIVHLGDGQLAGFEALVRWHHPQRGLVSPAEFVPVAEETGLIKIIGLRVLDCAIARLREWRAACPEAPALSMAVNLSPVQIADAEHVTAILDRLQRFAGSPDRIKLEITESLIMDRPEQARRLLHRLKDAGAELAIDDFGTGYSSFSYLHTLPFDTLKIDRSFVAAMDQGTRQQRIVRAIIGVAHDLGMTVVAEGVEASNTAALLRGMGCDLGQGYLWSAPLPAPQAARYVGRAPALAAA